MYLNLKTEFFANSSKKLSIQDVSFTNNDGS